MRSFGKIFKKGKYTEYMVIPNGKGEFHSEDLWYKGNFLNGQFHDLSKEASCHIKDQRNGNIQVFKGCFKNGQRHDYGELSLLFAGRLEPLLYYKGWWAHDEPDTGDFFNAEGNVFTRIERGVLGGVSLSNSGPTPPPPVPLRGEERRPRLQPDVHDAGTTPTTIGLVLPARVSSCAPDPSFLPDDQQEKDRSLHQRIVEELRQELQDTLARSEQHSGAERQREQEALEREYRARLASAEEKLNKMEEKLAKEHERRECVQQNTLAAAEEKLNQMEEELAKERERRECVQQELERKAQQNIEELVEKAKTTESEPPVDSDQNICHTKVPETPQQYIKNGGHGVFGGAQRPKATPQQQQLQPLATQPNPLPPPQGPVPSVVAQQPPPLQQRLAGGISSSRAMGALAAARNVLASTRNALAVTRKAASRMLPTLNTKWAQGCLRGAAAAVQRDAQVGQQAQQQPVVVSFPPDKQLLRGVSY